jgi:hypothetical protein
MRGRALQAVALKGEAAEPMDSARRRRAATPYFRFQRQQDPYHGFWAGVGELRRMSPGLTERRNLYLTLLDHPLRSRTLPPAPARFVRERLPCGSTTSLWERLPCVSTMFLWERRPCVSTMFLWERRPCRDRTGYGREVYPSRGGQVCKGVTPRRDRVIIVSSEARPCNGGASKIRGASL